MDPALITAGGLAALCGVFIAANSVIVPLRFYARRKQGYGTIQTDDWMVLLSFIFFIGTAGCCFYGVSRRFYGYSTPKDPAVLVKTLEEFEKLDLVLATFSVLTLGCSKLSALFFYRRIFCSGHGTELFHYVTIVSIVVVALWTPTFVVLNFFDCTPIWAMWTPSIKSYSCQRDYTILQALAISDVLLDCWIVILPMPKIWSIQSTLRHKLAIMGVFLLAFVGLGASIARLAIVEEIISIGQAKNFADVYLANTEIILFYAFEAGMSLIAVNLPSLWYFHSRVTLEGFLRSIRSITTLRSRSSRSTLGGGNDNSTFHATASRELKQQQEDNLSKSSSNYTAYAKRGSVDKWPLHKGLEEDERIEAAATDRIAVRNSIEQTTEPV